MARKKEKIKAPTRIETITIRIMVIIGLLSICNFLYFFFQPNYKGNTLLYVLLAILIFYGVLKKLFLWYHYFSISVPKTPPLEKEYKVDIFTTYFPGEPYEMTLTTLKAIQKITVPHTTYLCDEANDPYLKSECEKIGVIHVTRNNRIDAKAGNINNALKKATGDICLILDPDHIPKPNFLDVVLPHFDNEDIGFVQVVQAYHNKHETLVARGAAEQTFHFYGPMMMAMNTYGTVMAIGANCTFRRSALDDIGGHAPGLAEDMHTAMLMHAKGWKSVYVPQIVAKGLVPADLTSYFKQQLKWSRGTFELFYSVYPKIFKNLTTRQKIHYGLLPIHYLIGFVYLISFLIPILSLFLSEMPWTGNFLYFIIISIPVSMSSLMIRTYIQKWVIDRRERGFHIIGGILQIITWWIFALGIIYTFSRKKIPFLPTPKREDQETNISIVIPNLVIGVLSVIALIYGLNKDLTPFTLIMAFFALLNAIFMFASIYGAFKLTNRNRILRSTLANRTIDSLKEVKEHIKKFSNLIFTVVRSVALPMLIASILLSIFLLNKFENSVWENVETYPVKKVSYKYNGIFNPSDTTGISDLAKISELEHKAKSNYQIVSFYLPWGDTDKNFISKDYLNQIKELSAMPMISWEPWASDFKRSDSIPELKLEKRMLHHIIKGHFDDYIRKIATDIRNFQDPVFLRFAHEADNPGYPWSQTGGNTPKEFKLAWQHVHTIFEELHVENVKWVWNPWKDTTIKEYYPGDDYVDWIGVTLLNYGDLGSDGIWHDFESLYNPFHEKIKKLPYKPVMLAEMGSLQLGGNQKQWFKTAFETIDEKYEEINAVVIFNSAFDKNIPSNHINYSKKFLDWSYHDLISSNEIAFYNSINSSTNEEFLIDTLELKSTFRPIKIANNVRGVGYEKYNNWKESNYVGKKHELESDFKQMSALNINYIRYNESAIYNHNILKYSSENGLNILYGFDIPNSIDFVVDKEKLEKVKNEIVTKIHKLNEYENIKGWIIKDNIWPTLKYNFNHYDFLNQEKAYRKWLSSLCDAIKKIDSSRYLVQEIELSQFSTKRIQQLQSIDTKIDAYGLKVSNDYYLSDFLNFAKSNNIPYLISGITVSDFEKNEKELANKSIFIENWQNKWETKKVTFDGLLDFRGRKKSEYFSLANIWNPTETSIKTPKIRILKPAIRLEAEAKVTYHALIYKDGKWVYPTNNEAFEWMFVKYDNYGKPLATKSLGNGSNIEILLPENFRQCGIFLNYTKDNISTSEITKLNTPLHSTMNDL